MAAVTRKVSGTGLFHELVAASGEFFAEDFPEQIRQAGLDRRHVVGIEPVGLAAGATVGVPVAGEADLYRVELDAAVGRRSRHRA